MHRTGRLRPAHGSRSRVLRVLAAALLAAPAFVACSEVEARAPFQAIARPRLALAEGSPPVVPAGPWWTAEPARGQFEVVQALRTEPVVDFAHAGSPGLVRLFHRDHKIVAFVPETPGRVDRVRVRVQIGRPDTLRIQALHEGGIASEVHVPLFASEFARDVVVDLPRDPARLVSRVEVAVLGEGPAAFGRFEAFRLENEHLLPTVTDAPVHVRMGDDVRPGWSLTQDRPLEIEYEAGEDAILVGSAAVPAGLRIDGDAPALIVRVTAADGGLRVHRYPLLEADVSTSGWVWVRVPLEPTRGGRGRVRFDLESAFPDEAVCALTQPQVVQFDEDAPTVLLVTSDTHRGDHVGAAEDAAPVLTPVLDELAARGVTFTDAWSASNVTIPSHVSILTGLPLRETRVFDNTTALAADARTLAEAFAGAGWATVAAVSASHLDADWSGLGQGFDRMAVCRPAKRPAGETLAHLERWIPDYRGRPLFVWLHLFDAHSPYTPPPPLDRIAYPAGRDPRDPKLPEPGPGVIPPHLAGIRDPEYVVAQYRGEVSYLDSELARVLSRTRFRTAITAFTADHGESFGGHGVYWDHGGLYRDRLHVPLVLSWPGAPAGARVPTRVTNVDVGRTLLDLAGLAAVEYPGRNLLPAAGAARAEEPVFTISCFGFSASITSGDEMLVMHLADHTIHPYSQDGLRKRHAIELYDVARDPECQDDLVRERPERAKELRRELIAWLRAGQAMPWRATPQGAVDVLQNLTALGYAGESANADDPHLFPESCDCGACAAFER